HGDCALEARRVHRPAEVEREIGGRVDGAVAIGGSGSAQGWGRLSGERPVVAQRVGVAGGIVVAGLEDDLVRRVGAQGRVVIRELVPIDPFDLSGACGREVEAACDRSLVDVVVEGDADGRGGGDVGGVALGGVVDDLGWAAAAGGEREKDRASETGDQEKPKLPRG
ncbi:MAG TPA: hypothetical protein VKE27_12315, partial [Candidatus Dormibacteraeota bacterium]|nr:hypothetical protein [Candidatus Dormibacteraeota bacterium]